MLQAQMTDVLGADEMRHEVQEDALTIATLTQQTDRLLHRSVRRHEIAKNLSSERVFRENFADESVYHRAGRLRGECD
jgi:hypothetical protein